MSDARRVAEVVIDGSTVHHLYTEGEKAGYRVVRGLPLDAELVGAKYDPWTGRLSLLFRSKSFGEVVPGCIPPAVVMGYEWQTDNPPPVAT